MNFSIIEWITFCFWLSCFGNRFSLFPSTSFVSAKLNATIGEPIRGKRTGKIIYILKDGIKYQVSDWTLFVALGFDTDDIIPKSDAEMDSYPLGDSQRLQLLFTPNTGNQPVAASIVSSTYSSISDDTINFNDSAHLPPCPCRSTNSFDISTEMKFQSMLSKMIVVCIVNNAQAKEFLSRYPIDQFNFHAKMITEDQVDSMMFIRNIRNTSMHQTTPASAENTCDVIIELNHLEDRASHISESRKYCPGLCKNYPFAEIAVEWLVPPYNLQQELLCSLKTETVFAHLLSHESGHHHSTSANVSHGFGDLNKSHIEKYLHGNNSRGVDLMLSSIARRRIEECMERGRWPLSAAAHHRHDHGRKKIKQHSIWSNTSYLLPHRSMFPRRNVYGVILWVGSVSKLSLSKAQAEVLRFQTHSENDSQMIFPWIATEDQHPCRIPSKSMQNYRTCGSAYAYHWCMPSTKLGLASVKPGWACAQRRPLRAMSHTLLLYDPEFMLVVDDDTYVNIKLLLFDTVLAGVIRKELKERPIVLGQLNGGNKITRKGFFYGGSGYLMGRGVLEKLTSYNLEGPSSNADSFRDNKHLNHLGLMEEAYPLRDKGCPDDECMKLNPDVPVVLHYLNNKAALGVRLVDICTNVLAEEGTCYHSDHSMSRCLVHGSYADVWDVLCQGFDTPTNPSVRIAMCMGTGNCTANVLTCHRWLPNITDPYISPVEYTFDGTNW